MGRVGKKRGKLRRRGSKPEELIAGHRATPSGIKASTFVHILLRKAYPDLESFNFKHCLDYLQCEPDTDTVFLVRLDAPLHQLILGCFQCNGSDAETVISSFPIEVVARAKIRTLDPEIQVEDVRDALCFIEAHLARSKIPDRYFIISGRALRYWFTKARFTEKPMSTLLNLRRFTKPQLGKAVGPILYSVAYFSEVALRQHGSSTTAHLDLANKQVSRPDDFEANDMQNEFLFIRQECVHTVEKQEEEMLNAAEAYSLLELPHPRALVGLDILYANAKVQHLSEAVKLWGRKEKSRASQMSCFPSGEDCEVGKS